MQVIVNDCKRTRLNDRSSLPDFEETLKNLLIYYCNTNDVEYKQGLNEIMSPLLCLKNKINISIPKILNIFSCFIDNFLTNYYYEPELYAFRSSVSLLTLLLRYHDTELFNIFKRCEVSPQMYATNWLLTTYANKHQLDIVYNLWNVLIRLNDQLFLHFVVIAFLKKNRRSFIETDYSSVPLLFSKIKIEKYDEFCEIINLAHEINDKTPFSFRLLVNK